MLQGADYRLSCGISNIVVVYVAGYATVPEDVQIAVLEIIAWKYKREREHIGQSGTTIGGETVTFQRDDLPPGAKAVAENYGRVLNA